MAISTTNHDEIRKWAEAKGGKPAAVDRTHQRGDVGIIRIMFPKNPQSEHHSLVEISWDEFFKQFDESQLALVYEEDSLFSKIVGRDTLEHREHGEHVSRHHDRGAASSHQGPSAQSHSAGGKQPKDEGPDNSRHERGPASSHRGSSAQSHSAGGKKESEDSADLKSREYRDEHGNIHHHTRTYSEQHGGKT